MPPSQQTDLFTPTTLSAVSLRAVGATRYDAQQAAVINHRGSPARVMSGAGTGKSTTITGRTHALLTEAVAPETILIVTFTRKGAENIAAKLLEVCGKAASAITTGTFHRIAAKELIERQAGKERWHVLDEDDSAQLWEQAAEEAAIAILSKQFQAELFSGKKTADKALQSRIRSLFKPLRELRSSQVNMNKGSESFALFAAQRLKPRSSNYRALIEHPSKPSLLPFFNECLKRYEDLKQTHSGRDYDDLLVAWRDLLRSDVEYRKEVHARWQHVIIDEYQDTNLLQEDIVALLNTSNLVAVGDVAQCIFAWRSAVPELMLGFRSRYGGADFPLEFNYRSHDEILTVANEVLRQHTAMLRAGRPTYDYPDLQLRGTKGPGGVVEFLAYGSSADESTDIAHRIQGLLAKGVAPNQIAVLSRVSFYTATLEAQLRGLYYKNAPLPVQVWGGRSLLDSRTAKDLLRVFKAVARPTDQWPYMQLATLMPGIGEVAAMRAFLRRMFSLPARPELALLESTLQAMEDDYNAPNVRAVDRLTNLITQGAEFLRAAYATDKKLDQRERNAKSFEVEALEEGMTAAVTEMAASHPKPDSLALADLLNAYSLDPARDKSNPNALTISTIHSAKGLEWPHVFVVGVNEGTLPIVRKRRDTEEEDSDPQREKTELEEECRILYVALTRAKENLSVSYCTNAGMSRFLSASPLLREYCERAEELLDDYAPTPPRGYGRRYAR